MRHMHVKRLIILAVLLALAAGCVVRGNSRQGTGEEASFSLSSRTIRTVVDDYAPPNSRAAASSWALPHANSYNQDAVTIPVLDGVYCTKASCNGDVVKLDLADGALAAWSIIQVFDSAGYLYTVAKSENGNTLWKIDPDTMKPIASLRLSNKPLTSAEALFSGIYFYLDTHNRPVVTEGKRLVRYTHSGDTFTPDKAAD
jgi:hypothetical protein